MIKACIKNQGPLTFLYAIVRIGKDLREKNQSKIVMSEQVVLHQENKP